MGKDMKFSAPKIMIISAVIFFGLAPVSGYWFLVDRIPKVSAAKAKQILATHTPDALLIDVRDPGEYGARRIEGARNWPLSEIKSSKPADEFPQYLKDKKVFLICNSGIMSAMATKKLRTWGFNDAWNVRGGMDEWAASFSVPCPFRFSRMKGAGAKSEGLPSRAATRFEQWMLVFTSFVVKPLYILLSFALLVVIRKQKSYT
jgi:rhodanese-related sulfurtransferase